MFDGPGSVGIKVKKATIADSCGANSSNSSVDQNCPGYDYYDRAAV